MTYTREQYDAAVAKIAHTGEEKPSFDEWKKRMEGYEKQNMTRMDRVEKVTAGLVKEVMTSEH